MHIVSFHFLALVVAGLLLFYASPSRTWRRLVLLGLNAAFITSYVNAISELIPLAGFLLFAFVFIRAIQAWPSRRLLICGILVFIGAFVYLKQYPFARFVPPLKMPFIIVGLSYIFFRLLQVMVDAYQGAIADRVSLLRMLNHSCFFLSFVSGPIQRYQEYQEQEDALPSLSLSSETAHEAFSRIINGCIKIAILSVAFQDLFDYSAGWIKYAVQDGFLLIAYVCACMTYVIQLYLNFSGYMDVVIGVGRLFGFTLPENFDWPLSSPSFLEIWRRWHITLGEWFKLYLFNPLVKALSHRWKNSARIPEYGVLGFFVTFFIMGVWHEGSFVLVIYGLLLGFGVSVNKLYEIEMRKRLGKKRFKKLRDNALYAAFTHGLTIAYFTVTLTCLWMEKADLKYLAVTFGLPGAVLSFGLATLAVMLFTFVWSGLRTCLNPLAELSGNLGRSFFLRQSSLAIRVFFFVYVLFEFHSAIPEIAYMGF